MTELANLSVFDSWEPIAKARKPKGLKEWGRLQHIASKLDGKSSKDITFTTSYPGQEGKKKILGSIEGNLHFLLGYGNPGFHLADYHWQIIDPNLSDEEAAQLSEMRGHPSRIDLWQKSGLPLEEEGDLGGGAPHPDFAADRQSQDNKKRLVESSMYVPSGAGAYVAVPLKGIIIDATTQQTYKWSLVKDSFFGATNPEMAEKMNEAEAEEELPAVQKALLSDKVLARCVLGDFASEVYPFVKGTFPNPGSVVSFEADSGEEIYSVVTCKSLDFYDREGVPICFSVFDRQYESFDLTKGGDIHPSVLLNFAVNVLNVDKTFLSRGCEESMQWSDSYEDLEKGETQDDGGDETVFRSESGARDELVVL